MFVSSKDKRKTIKESDDKAQKAAEAAFAAVAKLILETTFAEIDDNHDGTLDSVELQGVGFNMAVMAHLDTDGDGKLSRGEFVDEIYAMVTRKEDSEAARRILNESIQLVTRILKKRHVKTLQDTAHLIDVEATAKESERNRLLAIEQAAALLVRVQELEAELEAGQTHAQTANDELAAERERAQEQARRARAELLEKDAQLCDKNSAAEAELQSLRALLANRDAQLADKNLDKNSAAEAKLQPLRALLANLEARLADKNSAEEVELASLRALLADRDAQLCDKNSAPASDGAAEAELAKLRPALANRDALLASANAELASLRALVAGASGAAALDMASSQRRAQAIAAELARAEDEIRRLAERTADADSLARQAQAGQEAISAELARVLAEMALKRQETQALKDAVARLTAARDFAITQSARSGASAGETNAAHARRLAELDLAHKTAIAALVLTLDQAEAANKATETANAAMLRRVYAQHKAQLDGLRRTKATELPMGQIQKLFRAAIQGVLGGLELAHRGTLNAMELRAAGADEKLVMTLDRNGDGLIVASEFVEVLSQVVELQGIEASLQLLREMVSMAVRCLEIRHFNQRAVELADMEQEHNTLMVVMANRGRNKDPDTHVSNFTSLFVCGE